MSNNKYLDGINKEVEEERHNYRGPHCCMTMHYELLSDYKILEYSSKWREYGVTIHNSSTIMLMDYCMCCGKKLPESLRNKWFDILEEEYKLESPISSDKKKVPAEFLTDEWWKKRGL